MLLGEIADKIGGKLPAQARNIEIKGLAPLTDAGPGDLSFLSNSKKEGEALKSKASAIICHPDSNHSGVRVCHPEPQLAMALAAQLFFQYEHEFTGIHPLAFIHPQTKLTPGITVFPFAYIGKNCQLSSGVVVYPQVYIGPDCKVGANTIIYPGASLMAGTEVGSDVVIQGGAVLGAEGFGFVPSADKIVRIPQTGKVKIADNVEIGPLNSIARATFTQTKVGKDSKFDALVHLGHNVEIGPRTMLCGQVGIAGSTKVGADCIAGGQVGITNDVEVHANTHLGGQSGVTKSLESSGTYMGMPAKPAKQWRREQAIQRQLPELKQRLQDLERRLEQLENPTTQA